MDQLASSPFEISVSSAGQRLRAAPRRPQDVTVTLVNRSAEDYVALIDVYGSGHESVRLDVASRPLAAGETAQLRLILEPSTGLPPGEYQVWLRVRAQGVSVPSGSCPLPFVIEPSTGLRALPVPGRVGSEPLVMQLGNVGNVLLELTLTASSPSGGLALDVPYLRIPPGAVRPVQVTGLRRPITSVARVPVTIAGADAKHGLHPATQMVQVAGLVPTRLVLSGVAVLGVLLVLGFGLLQSDSTPPRPLPRPAESQAAPAPSPSFAAVSPSASVAICPGVPTVDVAPELTSTSVKPMAGAAMRGSVFGGPNYQRTADVLLVGSDDRRVHAFEADGLTERWWSQCLDGAIAAQPTVGDDGNTVYALSSTGSLYTFKLDARGVQAYTNFYPVGGRIALKPTLSGDGVMVTSNRDGYRVTLFQDAGSSLKGKFAPKGTPLSVSGVMKQNPTSAHGSRLYIAHGAGAIDVYATPAGGDPIRLHGQLRTTDYGLKLDYVTVPITPAGSLDPDREMVVAAGSLPPARGAIVVWPAGLPGGQTMIPLAGEPSGRPVLSDDHRFAYVPMHSGSRAGVARVDLETGRVVTQTWLDRSIARPSSEAIRPSSVQLAGGYVALSWGRCLFLAHAELTDLRPIFCTDHDIQSAPVFDRLQNPTSLFSAGRDGRIYQVAFP